MMHRSLDWKLVNSDHSVAGLLIRDRLVRGFRIRTRVRKTTEGKNAVETCAAVVTLFRIFVGSSHLRSLLMLGCALKNLIC